MKKLTTFETPYKGYVSVNSDLVEYVGDDSTEVAHIKYDPNIKYVTYPNNEEIKDNREKSTLYFSKRELIVFGSQLEVKELLEK